jgi:hypothetical protein
MSSSKRPKDYNESLHGQSKAASGRRVPLQAEDTKTLLPASSDSNEDIFPNRDVIQDPESRTCCGSKLPLSPADSKVLIPKTNSRPDASQFYGQPDSGLDSPTPPPPPPLSPPSPTGKSQSETSSVSYTLEEFQQCYIYSFHIHDKVCREIELWSDDNRLAVTLRRPQCAAQLPVSASSLPIEGTATGTATAGRPAPALEEKGECSNLVALDPCMGHYDGTAPSESPQQMVKQQAATATATATAAATIKATHRDHPAKSSVELPHDANPARACVHYSQGGALVTVTLPKTVRVLEFRCD